jgi:hypothetical protein
MNKILTKREALIECRKMWGWLADNPRAYKHEYFKAKHIRRVNASCFACEYFRTHQGNSCKGNCILHWKGGRCLADNSEYTKWGNSLNKREAALAIVSLCDQALAELGDEQ